MTKKTWRKLNPLIVEKEICGKSFACIFKGKCQNLFIGKTKQRFLSDNVEEGAYVVALKVYCLKQKLGTGDDILRDNSGGKKDIGVASVTDIIAGPLKAKFLGNGKWELPEYSDIQKLFEKIQKED